MLESQQICPYTGLRSFTEEESLYFKGREEDIDLATGQLQRNKFLMLTGASGDGKSSLIYAGIIPNARSGFLKSKYSRWCIADFRPERDPFGNLCRVLARELDIPNPQTVESELNHGFSALVDLYKNSKRYLDTDSVAWQNAAETSRPAIRREAANLIILVDQFEEFFTNPENYRQGVPTRESGLVLNLLLEASRISLDEGLPIYVVFTMRSDYIGQCASFRGLAEYIGFSQFFVSRLNRFQLQQVIEEPATLSGNRISRRLAERLIHDITEGVDQLPILQHALNQIWVAAGNGAEEMDLIHYAMVGGMDAAELPDEQVASFRDWFGQLPAHIRACYHAPNLQNVLDTHTNKLFEEAAAYYNSKTEKSIPDADAKEIIRTAFTCLTKIDKSRAVRNRMTLQDITNILGRPDLSTGIVNEVLNIFREPGNTFLQPFISEEMPDSRSLPVGQVLDITHESLIRNWVYLGRWAKEEFDSRSISIDFGQQLDRWVSSGKSKDFLLSIGPLTYFESWKNRTRPNEWWIARYLPDENDHALKLAKAKTILSNANEFIRRSSARHRVTRTVVRLGPRRMLTAIALVAFIVFSSFAARNYFRKQNSQVLSALRAQSEKLSNRPDVSMGHFASNLAEQLKAGITTIPAAVAAIKDPVQQANIATGVATLLAMQGRGEPVKEIHQALAASDSALENLAVPLDNPARLGTALKEINDEEATLLFAGTFRPDDSLIRWERRTIARSARWVKTIFEKQPEGFEDIQSLTTALQDAINRHGFSDPELHQLLQQLSPLENGLKTAWLSNLFRQDKVLLRGAIDYGFKHNGLYQQLAALYAATGNTPRALQCLDTLIKYGQVNLNGDYAEGNENAANIAYVYYAAGKEDQLDAFVNGYEKRKQVSPADFYQRLIGRMFPSLFTAEVLDLYWWTNVNENRNLMYPSRSGQTFFFDRYRKALSKIKDDDDRNFQLAMAFKNEGMYKSRNMEKPAPGEPGADADFDQAVSLYSRVGTSYLTGPTRIAFSSGEDNVVTPRSALFTFPDYRTTGSPFATRNFFYFGLSDAFLDYVFRKNLFHTLYPGAAEVKEISSWLTGFYAKMFAPQGHMISEIPYITLKRLDSAIVRNGFTDAAEWNRLYLDLGYRAQLEKDTAAMLGYYRKVRTANILNVLQVKEFDGQANDFTLRLMAYAAKACIQTGERELGQSFISVFKNPINRSSLYAMMANLRLLENHNDSLAASFIDSARKEMTRTEDIHSGEPNRRLLASALIMQDPERNAKEAFRLIKNVADKTEGIRNLCRAYGFREDLYDAVSSIPGLTSNNDTPLYFFYILHGYTEGKPVPSRDWETFTQYYLKLLTLHIRYIDENN